MIAPCGMNCTLCMAYLREKNGCSGCLGSNKNKPATCRDCSIIHCENLKEYCYNCEKFPCRRLKQLNKRYEEKYNYSFFDNLKYIEKYGAEKLIAKDKKKYTCKKCGKLISVHREHICGGKY